MMRINQSVPETDCCSSFQNPQCIFDFRVKVTIVWEKRSTYRMPSDSFRRFQRRLASFPQALSLNGSSKKCETSFQTRVLFSFILSSGDSNIPRAFFFGHLLRTHFCRNPFKILAHDDSKLILETFIRTLGIILYCAGTSSISRASF